MISKHNRYDEERTCRRATKEQNYRGAVLSSTSRIVRVFTEKIYFLQRPMRRLELDRSMRRDYIAV